MKIKNFFRQFTQDPFTADLRWQDQEIAVIIARTEAGSSSTQANFLIVQEEVALTETSTTPVEPISTPTMSGEASATPVSDESAAMPVPLELTSTPALAETSPTAIPQPAPPSIIAMTDLNIRNSPVRGRVHG